MRKICVINHKGGVGKTTTAINIAAGLSRNDKKVLIIDFDAQGNLATSLRIESEKDIYHILAENADVKQCTKFLGQNLDVIPSKESLAMIETMLATMKKKEYVLREKLKNLKGYDYVILDCPPSIGLLNLNAILYAQEAFIPVSTDFLGFDALKKMEEYLKAINKIYGHSIKMTKVIPTMFDRRVKTCREYLDKISNTFYEITTDPIMANSKLKEAPAHGESIFKYAPSSQGAKDYAKIVKLIINEEESVISSYVKEDELLVPLNSPEVMAKYKAKKIKA